MILDTGSYYSRCSQGLVDIQFRTGESWEGARLS